MLLDPKKTDFLSQSRLRDELGVIDLPSLESLTVIEVSIPLLRISAPRLKELSICSVSLFMQQGSAGGMTYRERVDVALRLALAHFILDQAQTLEHLQLCEPIVVPSLREQDEQDAMETLSVANFLRLASIHICPGDRMSEFISSPALRRLEIGWSTKRVFGDDRAYRLFTTAETLVLASGFKGIVGGNALEDLTNVTHLQIRLDPNSNDMWDDCRFIVDLTVDAHTVDGSALSVNPPLFPKLRHIEVHFALWADENGLRFGGRQIDEEVGSNSDGEWTPDDDSEATSDTAEYYSDSSVWWGSISEASEDESQAENDGEPVVDADVEMVDGALMTNESADADGMAVDSQAVTHDADMEITHDPAAVAVHGIDISPHDALTEDDDPALAAAQEPLPRNMAGLYGVFHPPEKFRFPYINTRAKYGYILHALQYVVSSRRLSPDVDPLESIHITASWRVQDDLEPPPSLRDWFEENLLSFKAPS